ncbi:MAG: hypothetical protein ACOC8E_07115, partial [Planctomycetota bacterium]
HALLAGLAMGAMDQGADVTDAGMCSSDALYHAGAAGDYDLSLMVTASHNPAEFNGTKMVKLDGTSIGQNSGLMDVKRMVLDGEFPEPARRGQIDRDDGVMRRFIEHALRFIDPAKLKPFKIVVDAGNGMGGVLTQLLAEHVPFEIVPMNFEPDGTFPVHEADPTRPECVAELAARVKQEGADLGLGFDGDADRSALVPPDGRLLNGSELGSVIAKKLLRQEPGAKISYCLVSSWLIDEAIHEAGGEPVITPVGGANIRPMMKEQGIVLATERSGHFYLRDNNLADSGLIAALIGLEQLSEAGCSLVELIDERLITSDNRYYLHPEYSLMLGEEDSTIEELAELKAAAIARTDRLGEGARNVVTVGGDGDQEPEHRYEFEDWWFCVRPSGTEPRKLRMTVEARAKSVDEAKALCDEKYAQIKGLLEG